MKLNKTTMAAWRQALEIWKDRAAGVRRDDPCPLCELARGTECPGCPIELATGLCSTKAGSRAVYTENAKTLYQFMKNLKVEEE